LPEKFDAFFDALFAENVERRETVLDAGEDEQSQKAAVSRAYRRGAEVAGGGRRESVLLRFDTAARVHFGRVALDILGGLGIVYALGRLVLLLDRS
jgi:hypothetical protein